MRIVITGAPGAGKGTVAGILQQKTGMVHISTGDLFRENINNKTEIGNMISGIISSGELVDDRTTFKMLKEKLNSISTSQGFILDGFPRDITQVNLMKFLTTIDYTVNLSVSDEEVVERISGRRVCPSTGKIYHIKYNPPLQDGIDDTTGESLVQRDDDKPESVVRRLEIYKHSTYPILAKYDSMGLLLNIDENGMSAEEIADVILKKIS